MKALNNKMLVASIAIIASLMVLLVPVTARAQYMPQVDQKTVPVGDFTGINVTDDFDVTLTKGNCEVKITADKLLAPYVQVYVRSRVLYITYDQKAVPKDVRKLYKSGKNAPKPTFRAQISLPKLDGVELAENAIVNVADALEGGQVQIILTDKSQIKNLNLQAQSAAVNMKKNSQANLSLKTIEKTEVDLDGSANLKLTVNAPEYVVDASGQTELSSTGEGENASLLTSGSSKLYVNHKGSKMRVQMGPNTNITLTGEGEHLSIQADRNGKMEAGGYDAQNVEANLGSMSEVIVNVEKTLEATLVGGSTLFYTGTPEIRIGKVFKSTLAPYGSTAK